MKTYYTEFSMYEVDDHMMVYRRTPIIEQHVYSHRLVYGEWLPFTSITIIGNPKRLHIMAPDSTQGIFTSDLVEAPSETVQTS